MKKTDLSVELRPIGAPGRIYALGSPADLLPFADRPPFLLRDLLYALRISRDHPLWTVSESVTVEVERVEVGGSEATFWGMGSRFGGGS